MREPLRPGMIGHEFSKLDLGEMRPDYGMLCGPSESEKMPKKKVYPTVYVDRLSEPIDLPDEGVGKLKYRVKARNSRLVDGEKRHGGEIEIISIESEKEVTPAKKETKPIKLSALHPGMINFMDTRPRNGNGQFSPEQEGGIDPNAAAAAYGPPGQRQPRRSLAERLKAMLPGGGSP